MQNASEAVKGFARLSRPALLCGTALSAVVAPVLPARAAPPANARPQGGQVVAGAAAIGTTASATTITQSTNRAAIDWQSFNVGRNQSVTFQQPSPTAVTLNRVTGGDPSAIAGTISANGQVVLTNPSGVTFYKGSQVNAQSVIVSAAGITNQNFMAGRMVFDQAPSPNARIDNRGAITVGQAGLAALVAPAVRNSGVITAKMGHVVLAGAATHTLDLYGDGLLSLDVTGQVRQAPVGPGGKTVTALVTNTGMIAADGGTVQLTAAAADGVVQTLVRAGGKIHADSTAGRPGQIEIVGTGGSVVVEGTVAADGRAPGQSGGAIVLRGTAGTTLASTARVSASGQAGGGVVAVGTTLARATGSGPAPSGTSAITTVAAGARASADGRGHGSGGRVTVLSTQHTSINGTLSARGGKAGGDGGTVEMSGELGFSLTGRADTSALHGALGSIVLDPRDLTISDTGANNLPPTNYPVNNFNQNIAYGSGGTTTDAYVTPAQLQALSGNLNLQATRNLTVASSLNYTAGNIVFEAGNNLTVNTGITLSGSGNILLLAAAGDSPVPSPGGTLSIMGTVTAQAYLGLSAGTGGIALSGTVNANQLSFGTPGPVMQTAGTVTTGELFGHAASVSMPSFNSIAGVGNGADGGFTTTSGSFALASNNGALTVGSASAAGGITVPAQQSITLQTNALNLFSPAGSLALSAPGGSITLQPTAGDRGITLTSASPANKPSGVLALSTSELDLVRAATLQLGGGGTNGAITLGQAGETIDLGAHGGIPTLQFDTRGDVAQGGPLLVNALTGSAGSITLTNTGNVIRQLTGTFGNNDSSITTSVDLAVTGLNSARGTVSLLSGGNIAVDAAGTVAGPAVQVTAGAASVPGYNPQASLTVNGAVNGTFGIGLGAGSGGIAIGRGGVVSGGPVVLATAGAFTNGGGSLTTSDLSGVAGSVSLIAGTNSVAGIGSVSGAMTTTAVTGPTGFTLVDQVPLTVGHSSVGGGLFVPSQQTIALYTDSLAIGAGGGTVLGAPNGLVVVSPYTAGTPILLTSSGTQPAGTLTLTAAELSRINASQLTLGATNPATGQANTGPITLGQPGDVIDLGAAGFGTLGLNTTGAVGGDGALAVTTLTANVGSLMLRNTSNFIGTLAGITATGDISLHSSDTLNVGQLSGATVDLSSSGPGGMTFFGNVNAQALSVNSLTHGGAPNASDPGINQTAGLITAGTLTGAAGSLRLNVANQIGQLSDFTTYGELTVGTASPLRVTGAVTSQTYAVTLNAAGLMQTPTSSISAVEFDGSSSAATVLTAPGNRIQSVGYFHQTAGDFTLATGSRTLLFGGNGGQVYATNGSLTFQTDGVGLTQQPSGSITASGYVTFAPNTPSRRTELVGATAADPNSLSLNQAFIDRLFATGLALGTAATTGPVNIANAGETVTLASHVGTLALHTAGAVTEGVSPGGQNGGGKLGLTVQNLTGAVGDLSLTAAGNSISTVGFGDGVAGQLTGLTAAGSLAVTTSGTLNVANTVAAGAQGALSLASGAALSLGGKLSAGTINLAASSGGVTQTAGSITTAGPTDQLNLVATGAAVSQTGGAISTGRLTLRGDSATLPSTANSIGTLSGAAVSGDVTLYDAAPLTTAGSVAANTLNVTTAAGGLTVNSFTTLANLVVNLPGTLSGTGELNTGTLSGSAGSVALTGTNAVGTLGAFTTPGAFTLTDGQAFLANPLTVAGPLTAASIAITNNGPVTLSGTLSAPTVTLTANSTQNELASTPFNANGTFTQTAGSITGGTITLSAGDAFTQSGGALTATGALAIASQGALTLGGAASAASTTISAVTRSFPIDYGQQTQTNPGVIRQTGGVVAGVLSGHADSTATLDAAGNAVSALNGFSSTGGFSLTNGQALAVNGAVSDPTSIAFNINNGLTLNAPVTGGAVTLNVSGAVLQTAGTLTASSLAGTVGTLALPVLTNQIAALRTINASGGLQLADAAPLSIAGPVSVLPGQRITIADDQPSFAPGGSLSAPGGTVALSALTAAGITVGGPSGFTTAPAVTAQTLALGSPGGGPVTIAQQLNLSTVATLDLESAAAIRETGAGAIQVGTLTGQGASVTLGGANQVGTLAAFAATNGAFSLVNVQPLSVGGPVTSTTGVTISAVAGLTLAGDVAAPTILLRTTDAMTATASGVPFGVPGVITQTAGSIAGSSVTLAASDAVSQTGGSIGAAGAQVQLSSAGPLTLGGAVIGDVVSLNAVNKSAAGPKGSLVNTLGTITQTGGSIATAFLTGTSAGLTTLTAPGNAVTGLGQFASNGGFALKTAGALRVNGPVTDATAVNLTAASLAFAGNVTTGALTVASSGAITQGGGTLAANSLNGSVGTAGLTLGSKTNRVASLAAFVSQGDFALTDAAPVSVAGAVSAGPGRTLSVADNSTSFAPGGSLTAAGGTVALTEGTAGNGVTVGGAGLIGTPPVSASVLQIGSQAGGPVVIAGVLDATGVPVVRLFSAGAVSETGTGAIIASRLEGSGASAALGGANRVATLGTFSATAGAFTLTDAAALSVAGPVTASTMVSLSSGAGLVVAGNVTGASVALTTTGGDLTQTAGVVSALTGALTLNSAGAITQMGGTLSAPSLTGSSSGVTSLVSTGNAVTALDRFGSTGGFALTTGGTLSVNGPVTDTTAVRLTAGQLVLAGDVTTGALTLASAGTITQPGGVLTAASLSGSAGPGGVTLGSGGNQIASLGAFGSQGDLTLTDGEPVRVVGAVSAGAGRMLTIADNSINFAPGGSLTATRGSVVLTEATTGQGITLGGPDAFDAGSAVSAQRLTIGSAAGGPTTITGRVNLLGVPVPDLESKGAITETGAGAILAGALTGSGASASLGGANQIGTLRQFTATTGAFTLTNAAPLTVSGPVTGKTAATISVAGGLTLAGDVAAPTVLIGTNDGSAPGVITQTAGAITGSTVTLTSGDAFTQTGGAVGGSGATVQLSSAGPMTLGGTVTGKLVGLTATDKNSAPGTALGTITQPGGAVTADTLSVNASTAALGQSGNAVSALAASATTGDFTLTDGVTVQIAGAVAVGSGHTLTIADNATRFASGGSLSAPGGTVALTEGTPGSGITIGGGGLTGTPPVTASTLQIGSAAAGPVVITGLLDASGAPVVNLVSRGAISETGAGAIVTNTLEGSGAAVGLGGPNRVTTLGPFTATAAGFALVDASKLTVAGPVTAATAVSLSGGAGLTVAGSVTGASVALTTTGGDLSQTSGTVAALTGPLALNSAGAIMQTGGTLSAPSLTGSSVGVTSLISTGNAITNLGQFGSQGDFTLAGGAGLSITGAVLAGNGRVLTIANASPSFAPGGSLTAAGGAVVLTEASAGAGLTLTGSTTIDAGSVTVGSLTGGPVTIAGQLAGPALDLESQGAVAETGVGAINVGTLTGHAASLSLGNANQIGTLGGFTTGSTLQITDASPLAVAGPVSAGLFAVAAPSITLSGPVNVTTFAVSGGAVQQTGGALVADTLSGTADTVNLGGAGTAQVASLGPFTAAHGFTLTDAAPLTVSGPLAAPQMAVSATGSLTLAGGQITTDGGPLAAQSGAAPGASGTTFTVRPDAAGTAAFIQTGATTIRSFSGGTSTVRIDLPAAGGTLSLANLQAPGTDLVIGQGAGRSAGALAVHGLLVMGTGGGANFTGTVGTLTGFDASAVARISPALDQDYKLNGCAIAASSCGAGQNSVLVTAAQAAAAAVTSASVLRPDILTLDVLDLSVTRDRDDPTLLLPNISDKDY